MRPFLVVFACSIGLAAPLSAQDAPVPLESPEPEQAEQVDPTSPQPEPAADRAERAAERAEQAAAQAAQASQEIQAARAAGATQQAQTTETETEPTFVEMLLAVARVPQGQTDSQEAITDNVPPLLQLRSDFVTLRVGMLLSALVDVGFRDPQRQDNGFAMTDARLALTGEIGDDWSFLFQTDFVRSPSLLDFRLTYEPAPWMRIQAGRFKVPFGAEFLIPAADTDLNNRAQLNALVPGRSVGIEVGGRVAEGALFWRVGLYNGTLNFINDDRNYLGALRVGTKLKFGENIEWTLAANAAYSKDTAVFLGVLGGMPFAGERILAGADTRFTVGPAHLAAEFVFARFMDVNTADAYGFHVTAGYAPLDWFQVLLRYDFFETFGGTRRQLIIPSVSLVVPNLAPIQFQVDAEIPVEDPDQTRVIASMTVAF